MILYHFTKADRTKTIFTHGLLPLGDRQDMLGGAEIVWLTERTSVHLTAGESASVFDQVGELMDKWLSVPDAVRLTVRLPSHDRKLFKYLPWLRKNWRPGMPDPYHKSHSYTAVTSHWIYFGVIPPSKISKGSDTQPSRSLGRYRKSAGTQLQAA